MVTIRNLARSIRLEKLPRQYENQEKINSGRGMTDPMSKKRHTGVGGLSKKILASLDSSSH